MTKEHAQDEVRQAVRDVYAKAANGCAVSGCCGPNPTASLQLGYTAEDVAGVPDGANLGLGCGNPQAIAALRPGETVLDLGSGAGFDCFLAARQVGPAGHILGVDMTPAMISKARSNAARVGAANVEFRLGEIEHLPVGDASVDVILSNCVVNLSPDKAAVFREAFRVLSGMKSRVQRGREKLRGLLEDCCDIALDARGRVIGCEPRANGKQPADCRCGDAGADPAAQLTGMRPLP
jgi:SAM-dependent methyltransferase